MTSPVQSVYNWYRSLIANPKYRWWIIAGSLVYLISPIDISPDFIPFIGQLDDAVILTLLVSELSQVLLTRVRTVKERKAAQSAETTAQATPVEVNAVTVD